MMSLQAQEQKSQNTEAWIKRTLDKLSCPACGGGNNEFQGFVGLPGLGLAGKLDETRAAIQAGAFRCKGCSYLSLVFPEQMGPP
jgi:rubredoxin